MGKVVGFLLGLLLIVFAGISFNHYLDERSERSAATAVASEQFTEASEVDGWSDAMNLVSGELSSETPAEASEASEAGSSLEDIETVTGEAKQGNIDDFVAHVEEAINNSFQHHSIDVDDGNNVTVNIWQDGVALGATYAKAGDQQNLDSWEAMKTSVQSSSETLYSIYSTVYGFDGMVMVNVLNDQNTDNTLLSYINGVCVSDAVSD